MKTFLIEDHHRALEVWKQKKIKNAVLIHVDAHIDFGVYPVENAQEILKNVSSIIELKKRLQESLLYKEYEPSFEKQRDIGNYIYPAIRDGLIKEFWWVIPGSCEVFKRSVSDIKKIVRVCFGKDASFNLKGEVLSAQREGYSVNVTYLSGLPVFDKPVVLDVDTDFMVIPDLKKADNIDCIGKRKVEVTPEKLYKTLKYKIKKIKCLTVAYSVNGNWTPATLKYLGTEFAAFYNKELKSKALKQRKASDLFLRFRKEKKPFLYQRAIRFDKRLAGRDNNYGGLFLARNKPDKAKEEFDLILSADPDNPAAIAGLGDIFFVRKKYEKAADAFNKALNICFKRPGYKELRINLYAMLAESLFQAKKYGRAFIWANKTIKNQPLNPRGYFILAQIAQREKGYLAAFKLYEDCRKLGYGRYVDKKLALIHSRYGI